MRLSNQRQEPAKQAKNADGVRLADLISQKHWTNNLAYGNITYVNVNENM